MVLSDFYYSIAYTSLFSSVLFSAFMVVLTAFIAEYLKHSKF